MADRCLSDLTIVGGRPDEGGSESAGISPGLQALLQRLAENPSLARDLVANPEETLDAEGLTLTLTELAMLRHLEAGDLEQKGPEPTTKGVSLGMSMGSLLDTAYQVHVAEMAKGTPQEMSVKEPEDSEEDEMRRRLADQLELVAPFVTETGYMGEVTLGIRPMSVFPTPFAVAEALLRTDEDFRAAYLADPEEALLTWSELPLGDEERHSLLIQPILERLSRVARTHQG
jgi:hypothetical protein